MPESVQYPRIVAILFATLLFGCTSHPPGEHEERAAALQAGKPFEKQFEIREVPPLPENPTVDQLVQYALLNNAELEQHYWQWRAAIEQIPQDGSQSGSLNLAAGTMFTNGRASWGSSTVALGNDPMTDIKWPGKLDAAASAALQTAKAAGQRFIRAKYDLRNRVLDAFYDYCENAELIRLERANQQLLKTTATVVEAQNRTGHSAQPDLLKAENELDLSGNEIAEMESRLLSQRAALNAILSRPMDAPLPIPDEMPAGAPFAYSDAQLMELAAKQNPELLALADEIRTHRDAIRLAKLQYVPDFNLSAGTDLTGVTQSVLGQATIPIFRYEAIEAAIAQAQANLRASEATRRQAGNDLAAQVVTDIATLRDADRQLDLFQHGILPRVHQAVNADRSSYETGRTSLLDLLDEQRSSLAIERLVVSLRVLREKSVADLEAITATE